MTTTTRTRTICELVIALLAVAFLLPAADTSVTLQRHGNQVEVTIAGKPFTTYYFLPDVAKPYLMPLRAPSGVIVTRDFPKVNDVSAGDPKASSFEPHQRPLYLGHGNVDGLDFWEEKVFDHYYDDHGKQPYGSAKFIDIEMDGSGTSAAKIIAKFSLRDPSDREIGQQKQTFVFRGDQKERIVDCEFTLSATAGPLVFGDTKEGTFGIRLAKDLSAPSAVAMINSVGAHGEKEIWGKRADWVNYQGTVSGHPVSITVFDHPSSFRHPTTWHARAYGLFAANPFGWREFTRDPSQDGSWTVLEGKQLVLRYRVLIADGQQTPDQIGKAYTEYQGTR